MVINYLEETIPLFTTRGLNEKFCIGVIRDEYRKNWATTSMTEKELSDRITRWIVIQRLDDKQGLDEWTKLVNDIKGKGITDAEGRTRYLIGDSKTNSR